LPQFLNKLPRAPGKARALGDNWSVAHPN
jgi:hypothetical protein